MNALTLLPFAVGLAVIVALHHRHHKAGRHTVGAFVTRVCAFAVVYVVTYYAIEALK